MNAFLTEMNNVSLHQKLSTRVSPSIWPAGDPSKIACTPADKSKPSGMSTDIPRVICTYVLRTSRETATRSSNCLCWMRKDNWSHFWSSFTFKRTSQVICSNEGTKNWGLEPCIFKWHKSGPIAPADILAWLRRSYFGFTLLVKFVVCLVICVFVF